MLKRLLALIFILAALSITMSFVIGWIDALDLQKRTEHFDEKVQMCGLPENGFAVLEGGVLRCYTKRGHLIKEVKE